ncbi:DUF6456 domain-containing protein [Loktanella sp. DJP18]|uniref:DUF6456 domain-containing protein n=1 Tax=Loktanella sp. DJP18 TaxID=3409788 RepID=UPI003BB7273E
MTMSKETLQPDFPGWVPEPVRHYLVHTVAGTSIRALARDRDVHPSTILRQVRACEARRDDPLVDAALRALSGETQTSSSTESSAMLHALPPRWPDGAGSVSQGRLNREALHVLRRLCELGAVLAVARDMDSAVVVREDADGGALRTAVVEADIAQALALQNWISCPDPQARIARYRITGLGRTELRGLTAADENRAQGFDVALDDDWTRPEAANGGRFIATETPLIGLSRRRDKDGKPFLNRDLVRVGERLREDFVLSQPGPDVAEDWRAGLAFQGAKRLHPATQAARDRVIAALDDLGPGLQDAALRCCCLLEGLEITERHMGWSARSGKIVLRISLQRLTRHYEATTGKYGPLIS